MQAQEHKPPKTGRQRALSALPPQTPSGMTPASRYVQNLKVLRRRDSSIISIFDQFSHVCIYVYRGTKWEKLGVEGSMFLCEREIYPPYALYILNRMDSEDYVQALHPEDDSSINSRFLMIRSFPEYTTQRQALIQHDPKDKFSPAFLPKENLSVEAKGNSRTIGLWTQNADGREPMGDVLVRLYSYIKKNEPYPAEFQYTGGRLPPSNTMLYTLETRPASSAEQRLPSPTTQSPYAAYTPELNRLLSKLVPANLTSSSTTKVESTPKQALHSIQLPNEASGINSSGSCTGVPLLDSIFASASELTSTYAAETNPEPVIYSPTPTSSVLPQILNQDVILDLMGLSSRASSVAPSTGSSSAQDGDNEEEDDLDSFNSLQYSDGSMRMTSQPPASSVLQLFNSVSTSTSTNASQKHRIRGDETPRNRSIDTRFTSEHKISRLSKPFLSNSEVWSSNAPSIDQDEDIVELDYAETNLLSQPNAIISRRRRGSQSNTSEADSSRERVRINGKSSQGLISPENGKRNRRREKKNIQQGAAGVVLDREAVKAVVSDAARSRCNPTRTLERNEFVRELLTLIHTDDSFVDGLWHEYKSRLC